MAAPYSLDLRRKVIKLYKEKELTQQEVANFLSINLSTVKRYLRLDREKSSLLPKTKGKGRPARLKELEYDYIEQIIKVNPEITLRELSQIFAKKYKLNVGRSVLSRACQNLKLGRKKFSIYAKEQDREEVKKKN